VNVHRRRAGFASAPPLRPILAIAAGLLLGACGGETGSNGTQPTARPASQFPRQPHGAAPPGVSARRARTGRDDARRVLFLLAGQTLTVTLGATSDVRGFAGQIVRVQCASQLRPGPGQARTTHWPPGARSLEVRLGGDLGASPIFCSVDTASLRERSLHTEAILR